MVFFSRRSYPFFLVFFLARDTSCERRLQQIHLRDSKFLLFTTGRIISIRKFCRQIKFCRRNNTRIWAICLFYHDYFLRPPSSSSTRKFELPYNGRTARLPRAWVAGAVVFSYSLEKYYCHDCQFIPNRSSKKHISNEIQTPGNRRSSHLSSTRNVIHQ